MLDLRRRQFITLLGGAAAVWPLVARGGAPMITDLLAGQVSSS